MTPTTKAFRPSLPVEIYRLAPGGDVRQAITVIKAVIAVGALVTIKIDYRTPALIFYGFVP